MFDAPRLTIATLAATFLCSFSQPTVELKSVEDLRQPIQQIEEIIIEEDITSSPVVVDEPITEYVVSDVTITKEERVITEPMISDEEIDLIALVTMAEAEGESERGKRLVIDTILNRVDSELSYFPDTITEVIYQPRQFSSMWNGRVYRCHVDADIRELVKEELECRINEDVLYFHADKYGEYGTPMFSEGNHYFSS